MVDIRARIHAIADQLTHLEVNTILKPNMTGRKMPAPRHALIEIATRYMTKLEQLGWPVTDDIVAPPGGFASFDLIRERASDAIDAFRAKARIRIATDTEECDLVLLLRIKTMSDQIKGIFNALKRRDIPEWDNAYTHQGVEDEFPPWPLTPEEFVQIHKIWEMGLEEIAMQTVIQLDGDVVTRIMPKYANEEGRIIHQIHHQGVSMSLQVWGELVGLVGNFFQTFFGKPAGK